MMNNVVNFAVLLVGVIALVLATSGYTVFAIASVMVALGCVGWAYFKVLGPLHQRGNLADGILKRIISGELKDADGIRQEWVLGLSVIRRGWLRQARGRMAALKRTWRYQGKPRLSAFAETCRRRWEAGLAASKETWRQEKARLVALKETSQQKWKAGLAALRETWYQEKARLVALAEAWRLW